MLPLNRSVAQVQYHLRFATFGITTNAQKKGGCFANASNGRVEVALEAEVFSACPGARPAIG